MTLVNCTPGYSKVNQNWKNMWSPFENELFNFQGFKQTTPAVNIRETAEAFNIELAAPGLSKEDFNIHLEKEVLMISAKKENKQEVEGEKWTRKEFSFSSFERSFRMPETISSEGITAKYENGVLMVSLPKRDEAKEKPAREITIG